MALVAVSSTINGTLVPLLSGEVKLLWNIHTEVANIKAELESIMSFLKDADSSVKLENERARNWVKQVRAVAYHIEDVMDEYILHLAENWQRRGFIGFLRKLSRSITKLKPQHDIASQIQDIKQIIREIKERADRYGFSSLELGSSNKTEEKVHDDPRIASLFIKEDEVVGIESTKEELIHTMITRESSQTVTSLVAMGGCGKTTLAKAIFDNQKVFDHFDCQAWVSVSQSYKMTDIFRRMIKQIWERRNEKAPEGIDTMDQNSLIHMLREYLVHKRFLVVFDDVWSTDFWRFVKLALPRNNKGSQIIITTRSEDVASFCKESSSDHVYKLEPLIEEEAWKLFCMKAFQLDFGGRCPPELEKVSRAIVRKCEGLPLAIVTIGALLSTKSKVVSEWQRFYNSIGSELERNPHLANITKILLLSYNDLPCYLKSCFLYFSIIPEDYQITRGRLIRLWIAEGFIERHRGKTLEEVAEEHLTELVRRSLVQVSATKFDGRIKRCQVHDLVHEMILTMCEELSFCHTLGEADPTWNDETRRWSIHMHNITIHMHNMERVTIKELGNLRQLRKLGILKLKRENGEALCTAIEKMKHLQSLRVSSRRIGEILDLHSLSSPPESLQCLSLRGRLETLPNWISKLNNLGHLTLRWSGLTDTHAIKALQALPNLIELNIMAGYDGEQLYFEVGGFQKLKVLYLRFLKRLNSIVIEEGGLPVLNQLWIGASPRLMEVPSGIRNLRELKSLYFEAMPPMFLNRMKIDEGQDYWIVEHIPIVQFVLPDDIEGPCKFYTPQEFQVARESNFMRLGNTKLNMIWTSLNLAPPDRDEARLFRKRDGLHLSRRSGAI